VSDSEDLNFASSTSSPLSTENVQKKNYKRFDVLDGDFEFIVSKRFEVDLFAFPSPTLLLN